MRAYAMLSYYERRNLDRIEQWFHVDDPVLAEAWSKGRPPVSQVRAKTVRLSMDVLAGLLLVLGALASNSALFFFGTIIGAIAVCLHVRAQRVRDIGQDHR
jgi:uncharacterized membrane protein YphA (DoxX/SURF4 family)